MGCISSRLAEVKDDPTDLVDPVRIRRACRQCGHRWRERLLGPVATFQAIILQMLHGNTAIAHVKRLMDDRFSESAYCQARARLPVAVVRAVLSDFVAELGEPAVAAGVGDRWKGHRVVMIDGTGTSTPDCPKLREHFGVVGGVHPGCGLPCASVLSVFRAGDGVLLDMHIAKACTRDIAHAHSLHAALQPGDVLVGDRGLCAYTHLAALIQRGCHGLFRMPTTRSMPFPARRGERRRFTHSRHRHSEPILVELVSKDDQVVELVKPHNRTGSMSPEEFAAVPSKLVVRAVRYRVTHPGYRSDEITLLTTLIDAKTYSAQDLAGLYLMRWRVEVNIRHLKRTLGMDRLRCQTIEGVTREILMIALVYNAVCRVRAVAAAAQKTLPARLSFVDTLRWIIKTISRLKISKRHRLRLLSPPTIKAWPSRSARIHPRKLKRAHSGFPIMDWPRASFVKWVISKTPMPAK